jgi:4-amino-4-deoxy-L-arabinose transferase-like glycosyltransferase
VLIFEMTRRLFSMPAAVLAAVGATLLPTLVLWSIVTLKESLVLFVSLVGLRIILYLTNAPTRDKHFADASMLLFGVFVLLLDLRTATAFILILLLGVVYVARAHFRWRLGQLGFGALALVVVAGGLWVARTRSSSRPFTSIGEDVVLQIRHRRAQEASAARSQLRPEAEIYTPTGGELPAAEAASDATPFTLTGDVLDPLGYALLAPAPWQARNTNELGASAEMPVWYALLGASFLSWRASPRQRLFVICLVVYGVANWLVLAATEGNLGNLLRHRLMLDPVLLILGAAGLEWLWARSGRPFSTRVPPLLVPARVSDS